MGLCRFGGALRGAAIALVFALAGDALAAPDGRPRLVQYLGNLADHDPEAPAPGLEPWTPADVAALLAAHPHASVALGRREGPAGHAPATRLRQQADQIRALAAEDVSERLCLPVRVDVQRKLRPGHPHCEPATGGGGCDWEGDMDGSLGEPETVVKARGHATGAEADTLAVSGAAWAPDAWARRLVVVRPRTVLEERRRVLGNDATTLRVSSPWERSPRPGDAYEIRGSFDPQWVMRVPAAAHDASIDRQWRDRRDVCGRSRTAPCAPAAEPLDPLAAGNRRGWGPDLDRDAIAALATASEVPALHGTIRDADPSVPELTDPHPQVDSVVMDLRDPGYRAWRVRSLLYALQDHGIGPGAGACVILGYEPASLAHYDEAQGPSRHPCALADTSSWQAPLHVCSERGHPGGPLAPTRYGPGEFEAGLDALVRELLETLPRHGYERLRIVTAEGEPFLGRPWSTLAADVRFDVRMVGELDRPRAPRLATLPAAPLAAPETARGGGGSAGRPATASAATRSERSARPVTTRAPRTPAPPRPQPRPSAGNGSTSRPADDGAPAPTTGSGRPPRAEPTRNGPSVGGPRSSNETVVASRRPERPTATAPPTSSGGTPIVTSQPATPIIDPRETAPTRGHEPPGMTPRQPMNPMNALPPTSPAPPDRYGYLCWPGQCRTLSIERDPTSPGTDPSVLRVTYPKGHAGGNSPSRFLAGADFGGKRRLYTSVYLYLSPNWSNGGNGGTKFFFMRARADGVQNHYVNLAGDLEAPFTTGVFLQTPDGLGNRNMPVGPVPVGRWFRLELYLQMNDPGQPNGIARLWIDGTLELERADITWAERLSEGRSLRDVSWDHLWVDPTYGGGSNPVPAQMYFQVDDWYTSVAD